MTEKRATLGSPSCEHLSTVDGLLPDEEAVFALAFALGRVVLLALGVMTCLLQGQKERRGRYRGHGEKLLERLQVSEEERGRDWGGYEGPEGGHDGQPRDGVESGWPGEDAGELGRYARHGCRWRCC